MCNPGDDHYNSLQVQADKRMSNGLNVLGNYTYSHSKNHDTPDFLYDKSLLYGRPSWQRNQVITVSTIYELPFGKGKMLAGNAPYRSQLHHRRMAAGECDHDHERRRRQPVLW